MKRLNRSKLLKWIAAIVVSILLGLSTMGIAEFFTNYRSFDYVTSNSYEETRAFQEIIEEISESLKRMQQIGDLKYLAQEDLYQKLIRDYETYGFDDELNNLYWEFLGEKKYSETDRNKARKEFNIEYVTEIREAVARKKEALRTEYKHHLEKLMTLDGIDVIADSSKVSLNTVDSSEKSKDVLKYQYGYAEEKIDPWILNKLGGYNKVFIKMAYDKYEHNVYEWSSNKEKALNKIHSMLAYIVISFIIIIWIIATSGRNNDEELEVKWIDKVYFEIYTFMVICVVTLWGLFFQNFCRTSGAHRLVLVASCLMFMVFIQYIASISRRIKGRIFIKQSLCYRVVKIIKGIIIFIIKGFVNLFKTMPLGIKMMPTPKKVKNFKEIVEGTDKIKNGDLNYKIEVSDDKVFYGMAQNINDIADGLKMALENEVRSERLKTELISNVSHDIRTPLTSIINYIDIIDRTEELSEEGKKYISILKEKSQRLKQLTDNLFEISKASSGNVTVELSEIDVHQLIFQSMGEMSEKIEESNLEFIVDEIPEIIGLCDGKLMWRVFENLLNNILKYSMDNSRVYIDCYRDGGYVNISFKNISRERLNVGEEELMQRFARGDESRSTEGSGLGLSIVKSLMVLQNGKFDLKIDGDLFKAVVSIPEKKKEKEVI